MITPNPLIGTGLHAVGGISASTCYLPFQKTQQWSWGTFWLVQALFAWILVPLILGYLTVPDFFQILREAPAGPFWAAFFLGALYGFGGMSFGKAIVHIGYSLTYSLAIGISAVIGTLLPLMMFGGIVEYFSGTGGNIVLTGMIVSVIGVGLCGFAGFRKERDLSKSNLDQVKFNMMTGLFLTIVAGVLSGVFNISLEVGQPIADIAADKGAGHFQGNAKLIVSTSGCFLVNLIWFVVAGIRHNTLKEFTSKSGIKVKTRMRNMIWSSLAGTMWCFQFFFYGLGHVRMGSYQFASWVIHMSMLIFFSYVVGIAMKEWRNVSRGTYITLVIALSVLVLSFVITTIGSVIGQGMIE